MLVLMFQAGDDHYALAARSVEYVTAYAVPKPLPGAPRWHAGLLMVHNVPIPIIDLGQMLTNRSCAVRWSTRIIFLRINEIEGQPLVGLLAERVTTATLDIPTSRALWPLGSVLLHGKDMVYLIDSNRLFPREQSELLLH